MSTPAQPPSPYALQGGAAVHLVGIGGAGMSALACLLLERGHAVSGTDLRRGRSVAALEAMGATCHIGHAAEHLGDASVVAVSTAVPQANPEVVAAQERGVPVLRRAELLAALMADHERILVAGTHGKTTTTSMVTVALQHAGLAPSFAIGGTLHDSGTSAHHGDGRWFVAEADESDGSFLVFAPHCAVVTNVELDHHDHWEGAEQLDAAFERFLAQRVPEGLAVMCIDDPGSAALARRARPPVLTYGEAGEADVRVVDVELHAKGSAFTLERDGAPVAQVQLRLPGRHNVLNAAAALLAAEHAGATLDAAAAGLRAFSGAQRRFQRVGEAGGVAVVDDYAHHPTEISAVLQAARQVCPDGKVIAVFQPHRYSRTAALGAELGHALAGADAAIVTDVYASGEEPVPGVGGPLVVEAAVAAGGLAEHVGATSEIPAAVARLVSAGDLVLVLGAGDITEVTGPLIARLEGA